MTARHHTVAAAILALTGLFLLRLAGQEIQPWDEGLYAVRAESIVRYDAWWDQTPHALGGLYSSTPPPMVPWVGAVMIHAMGPTPLAVRLFSALCAGMSLWLIFLIARRFVSFEHAVVAMCMLAGTLPWLLYGRQMMTEVPLMTFVLTAFWAALRMHERKERADAWRDGAIFAVAFAAALLTKMVVSLLPLLFLIPYVVDVRKDAKGLAKALWPAIAGILLALPWYVSMVSHYGDQFWLALTVPHMTTAVEGNSRELGALYYVNQLFIGHALSVVAFVYVVMAVIWRSMLPTRTQQGAILAVAWFVAGLLIFSIAATKNPHYTVILVPAVVLVAVYGLERMLTGCVRRMIVVIYGLVSAVTLWSLLSFVRIGLRTMFVDTRVMLIVAFMAALAILPLVLPRRLVDRLSVQGYRTVIYGACAIMILRCVAVVMLGRPDDIEGGKAVAEALRERTAHTFVYLYHRQNAGDAFNPQLAWYTRGWMAGWNEGYTYTPVALNARTADESTLIALTASGKQLIVYYHPGISKEVQASVASTLAIGYVPLEMQTPHYTVFRRLGLGERLAPGSR